jgi:hypothetical protein
MLARYLSVLPLVLLGFLPFGSVDGRVNSLDTGLVVEGAVVTLVVSGLTTTTDRAGQFSFPGDLRAPDTLVVVHPDFVSARIPLGPIPVEGRSLIVRLLSHALGEVPPRDGTGDGPGAR